MKTEKEYSKEVPLFISRSSMSTEVNKTGSWRFVRPKYDEKTAPCSTACPAGEDIGRIEMLANQGLIKEAWETILIENPFPAVCGRVCFHPCETVCNRAELDEPVAIRHVERFLGDAAVRDGIKISLEKLPDNGKKVCIVGAGGFIRPSAQNPLKPGSSRRKIIPKYCTSATVKLQTRICHLCSAVI